MLQHDMGVAPSPQADLITQLSLLCVAFCRSCENRLFVFKFFSVAAGLCISIPHIAGAMLTSVYKTMAGTSTVG